MSGTSESGVAWSLAPQIGALTSAGRTAAYVAPAVISSTQTVTITATSLANDTTHATATVRLASATVQAAGTQQFTATVFEITNTTVG